MDEYKYKLHPSEIDYVDDDGDIMPNTEFVELCAVCKTNMYDDAIVGKEQNFVLEYDVLLIGDVRYIVFQDHESCREMFEVNPLAYE